MATRTKSAPRASKRKPAKPTEPESVSLQIKAAGKTRSLTVRPDGVDFRDRMYVPTLVEVPVRRELIDYRQAGVPILDQGQEGACTGFGLATVAHYLLRTRRHEPDGASVSPHMFYDLARRYDEWAGEDYEGSSCRGAMKGWHKHGICVGRLWPAARRTRTLSERIEVDAAGRPLGAYFRVNHTDLVAMHAALAEVGILYASASVHAGWQKVGRDGRIKLSSEILGGHAFAIVAYDEDGFWIQNSWGEDWGHEGFCHVSYDDWLANGTDVWVARLGAPVRIAAAGRAAMAEATLPAGSSGVALGDIRPHVINIGNDGELDPRGDIGTTEDTLREILQQDFPRITQGWQKKRIVLYAHGGLVSRGDALKTVETYRRAMLEAECYPLAFIWKSDYFTTLANMLADAARKRRPEGFLDSAKDFMLDRLDDTLEPIARVFTGKASWDEMRENALLATRSKRGGARLVADGLIKLVAQGVEIHLAGHSAGSIFHAPLLQYLTDKGVKLASCTLWAPAVTTALFKETYLPAIKSRRLAAFNLFTLTDQAEQDDNCARIYNKSLLYLVSNAFEAKPRIPLIRPDGEPLLGMEKFVRKDGELSALFKAGSPHSWVTAPNNASIGSVNASTARHHGDFDNDEATVKATLARILGKSRAAEPVQFVQSDYEVRRKRCAVARVGAARDLP